MKNILSRLLDEYVERHRERLELLSRAQWVDVISRGKSEVDCGVKGKALNELAD